VEGRWLALHGFCLQLLFFTRERGCCCFSSQENVAGRISAAFLLQILRRHATHDWIRSRLGSAESARLSMGRQLGSPAQLGSSASVKKMFRSATLSIASSCRPFAPADSKKKTSFACAADSLELSPLPAVVPLTLSPSPWDPCQALFQYCDVGCFSMAPTTVTGSLACVCIFVVFAFVSFSRQASLPAFSHCSSTCVSGADYR
jgi:hypothetical protein